MEISAKEWVMIFLGIVISTLLLIWLEYRGYFRSGIGIEDLLIMIVVVAFAVLIVISTKFKEINKDLIGQDSKLKDFSKKLDEGSEILKRAEDLIDIKSDIKEIKRRLK